MGNKRKGHQRITFFLRDNIALQVRENAHREYQTMTDYITEAILRRIEDERSQGLKDAQKNMHSL